MCVSYYCVICGFYLTGGEHWSGQFRAVYSTPDGIFISGVGDSGWRPGGGWCAPSHYSRRWCRDEYYNKVPYITRDPDDISQYWYVFHEVCWKLLTKAFEPDVVPLERLLLVCRSVPFLQMGLGVYWGHKGAGFTAIDDLDRSPWEKQFMDHYGNSKISRYAQEDPYNLPKIDKLIAKISSRTLLNVVRHADKGDCFSRLPWEILDAIAMNLPTRDALNLRRVTKSFVPLLTSQRFWASRFKLGGDRDFFFEAQDSEKSRDWLSLYRATSHVKGLKNRRRVWGLIQLFIDSLRLRTDDTVGSIGIDTSADGLRWTKVAGDIYERTQIGPIVFGIGSPTVARMGNMFRHSCQLLQKQSAFIPSDLSKIAFSIAVVGGVEYVVGIRFISSNNSEFYLGYSAKNSELVLKITNLRGFILAMTPQGIQAVQVVDGDERPSRWFGSPKDAFVTERLARFSSIHALEVGIDGYKMVSLAVAELETPNIPQPIPSPFRDANMWSNTVPSPDLLLNEESFTGERLPTTRYEPLFWIHFGGPGGINLRSLTHITVTRSLGIEFHYNTDHIPIEMRRLGCHHFAKVDSTSRRFVIDGPGGELIETIEVSIERRAGYNLPTFYRHGTINSFKITTNRGRSVHFRSKSQTFDTTLIPLSITPGSTLTGLYAGQHPGMDLMSLGAISEVIRDD